MAGKLLNIRLSDADAKKVDDLRKAGLNFSDLVRRALREEHSRACRPKRKYKTGEELVAAIKAIHEKYPIPDDAPYHGIDTTDRKAVQAYIREQMMRKQERIRREIANAPEKPADGNAA